MLEINSLATDPKASEEGVWATFLGGRFLIARNNNDAAQFLRSKLALQNWDVITAGGEKAEELALEISAEVLATHVLLDWANISVGGQEVAYTPELGKKYLLDKRFRDLHQFVENFSLNRTNYREKAEQEVAESVKDSAGS